MRSGNCFSKIKLAIVVILAIPSDVQAHFPWLAIDEDNRVVQFFGENVANRNYKLPEKIATAEVLAFGHDGTASSIAMETIEIDEFIGRRSQTVADPLQRFESNVTYGIHGGSRLDYYSSAIPGKLPKSMEDSSSVVSHARLKCLAFDTEGAVKIQVTWENQPLIGTEVKLFNEKGDETASEKTNANGQVDFTDAQVEEGMNAILVGFIQKDEAGKLGDRVYQSASHYLTMTFRDPEGSQASPKSASPLSQSLIPDVVPPAIEGLESVRHPTSLHSDLPLPLTSFGAVRHGSSILVYGGHTGEAHHYSTQEQSGALFALDLTNFAAPWKELSKGRRLQGLGLVAFENCVIRVGGFEAVNGLDDEHDLRSSSEVMSFDLEKNQWTKLPDLPEPRSSHDAIVVGDRLYVIGGWTLQGTETKWLSTAWSIQLPAEGKSWEAMQSPPFSRRAIALAATHERIFAIGGMNEKGGPTTEVATYDLDRCEWQTAPSLQGRPMNGFGAAASSLGDTIITTTSDGDIQTLTPNSDRWEITGKVRSPRFFHRLLPYHEGKLVALGGVNMTEQTKLPNLEIVTVPVP
jgi:Galactose oxidase, central domain